MDNRKVQKASKKQHEVEHVVSIYGELDDESCSSLVTEIGSHFNCNPGKPLIVNINSNGGFCNPALAVYGEIRRQVDRGNTVITRVLGKAGSMACVIFQAGSVRQIGKYGSLMIHATTSSYEKEMTVREFRNLADDLEFTQSILRDIYAERTGISEAHFNYIVNSGVDHNFRSKEAISLNLADEII